MLYRLLIQFDFKINSKGSWMKSVLKNMFACSLLMLASVAAHATAEDEALARVVLNANGHAASNIWTFGTWKNTDHNLSSDMASSDDDQADSSDADTMLA